MAGFVNFKYRDGMIPSHTKSSFNSMKVLTVQNFIAKNALIFIHKVLCFPHLLPKSVRETVPNNVLNYSSTYENNRALLESYENAGPYFYCMPIS